MLLAGRVLCGCAVVAVVLLLAATLASDNGIPYLGGSGETPHRKRERK